MGRTLVIPIMYGEIPEHIRHTFQLDNPVYGYELLPEGANLPPANEVSGVIVLYADNDHDRTTMLDLSDQLRHFYSGIPVIYLPVETQAPPAKEHLLDGLFKGSNQAAPVAYVPGHPLPVSGNAHP